MPGAVAAAITAAVVNAGVTSLIAAQIVYAAAYVATSALISFGFNALVGALSKPKSGNKGGSFTADAANRTVTLKQPVEPWHVVYGSIRKSGVYTFIGVSGGNNDFLHLVVTVAGHRLSRIGDPYFDNVRVPLDDAGEAIGTYSGFALFEKRLGLPDQTVFSALNSALPEKWTADHRQRGLSAVHCRLKYDEDKYANGVPNISFDVDGKPVFDPRDTRVGIMSSSQVEGSHIEIVTDGAHGFSQGQSVFILGHSGSSKSINGEQYVAEVTAANSFKIYTTPDMEITSGGTGGEVTAMHFSSSSDLCIADYFMNREFGMKFDYSFEIEEDVLLTAVGVDEEMVELIDDDSNFKEVTFSASDNTLLLSESMPQLLLGDGVKFTSTDALPPEITAGTLYYYIYENEGGGKLATSLVNARRRIAIDLTGAGSGTITMQRSHEPRYQMNGTFKTDQTPVSVAREMLSSNGGHFGFIGGKWHFYPAYYRAPTVFLDEDDLRGEGFKVMPVRSGRNSFNAVKGVYVSPANQWQPGDFPAVKNATYLAEDNGEREWRDLDLPWTTSTSAAQRLAKIELERSRQEITIPALNCKLNAYTIQAGTNIGFTVPDYGWDEKEFETVSADLQVFQDGDGNPVMGMVLSMYETAEEVYAWDKGEEQTIDPAPDSGLPNPFFTAPPENLNFNDTLYVTTNSSGVKARVDVFWDASPDAFVNSYQAEYRVTGETEWTALPRTSGTTIQIFDVTPGNYDFRVKAINTIGVSSEYIESSGEVQGLIAQPEQPIGVTLSVAGQQAIIRWDPPTELDVLIGGVVDFRHTPNTISPDISETISIGKPVSASDQFAVLPLKPGSYAVRFVDSSGIASEPLFVATDGATILEFTTLTQLIEHPGFSGDKENVVVQGGELRINGGDNIDDWGNVDDVVDWDFEGGVNAEGGTYTFSTVIDLGSVKRFRLRPVIVSRVINQLDLFDSRLDNIDTWANFDGVAGAEADAQMWVRTSPDGPGSPIYNDYQRIDSSEHEARLIQPQLRLSTTSASFNIVVEELTLNVEEVVV